MEVVDEGCYMRTVAIGAHSGWIAVSQPREKSVLNLQISNSLAPVLKQVLTRTRRLFDLNADPALIAERLGSLAIRRPGLRVPGAFDGFETAVRAILGQQVSVRAATTLAARFTAAFGTKIETPIAALTHLTPTPERVAGAAADQIAQLGIVFKRAECIKALAEKVHRGELKLNPPCEVEDVIKRLKQLPGVGDWTAQYIAMRALSWPDAFPHSDLGICKALGEKRPDRVLSMAEPWRPWRAYATMQLWLSLEEV